MPDSSNAPVELGTRSISKLLKQYAVPGIIAMTATSLYNMVDSIFIGHIRDTGAYAISALGICAPIMNLGAALGTLVGVGASTIVSVLLGQRNYETAGKVLRNEITLNLILGTLFTVLVLAWEEPILYFFGASERTMPFAKQYLTVIMAANVISHLYFGLNSLIRSAGNPKTAMGLTLFTVISNAILDPVFIFVLDLGVQGAAIATVLCQLMALVYTFRYFSDRSRIIHFSRPFLGIDWRIARNSLAIGMGPFLMNSAACIVNRISFFFLMIVMGFNQGMQPIAGYNFGARRYSRVKEVFFLTSKWATGVVFIGFIISVFFPNLAVSAFTDEPQLKEMAGHGLQTMNILFPIIGFQMVATNLFQCLGMVHKSIILSLSRQLLFLVPSVFLLPILFDVDGVWYSFPLSDFLASILTVFFLISLVRKLNRLNDGDNPDILGSKIK